ncbi:putative repeat protein (TIGR02543 family) [Treponema rectale]|uniref:Putative repeat protein (TIGR02543 family) n=1 Tax=Treponema rectale TaxID=744512 RepID=A0A840SHU1_9SPIR|nr:InlB B-repeat-containing protein [Treponema rectale]MBB5219718.1 putative repeat protein (TIGR02543 family) [Treponema rectale]
MKKYGKITALIAGVVLALGFASCKADTDDGSTFYTVTFNSMGGTEVSSQSIESGNKATKPVDPTKTETATEGFVFAGWYTSTDRGTTLSETAFDFNTAIKGDITLYAKWTVNAVTHTVTFDTKGGSTSPAEQTIVHGKKATKPADPTKAETETEAFVFAGWYTSTDRGTTLSDTAFDFDTAIEEDITLYAKWTENAVTHTVTFDTKGGSMSPAEQTIVHGKKATKPADPTKQATETETYIFDNWYTSTDGGATLSETAFDFDTAISDNITLYAKWTVNVVTHTVTFDTKGGSTSPAEQTIVHGNKATKPADPAKTETETEAFVFAGWYTSTDGGTTLSDTAFDFDTAITDNISLYAKWNVYTIEYIELKDCSAIRTMFETLCEFSGSVFDYKFKKTITSFAKADARPEAAENYIDAAGNQIPLWYDEGKTTLYYYLEPGKKMSLRTSDGKNSLFKYMVDAVSIETGDFDTSNVTDMSSMFSNCRALTSLDVSKFDTSKVTDMSYMFSNCRALTSLDVSSFDTSKVTDMSDMFFNCQALITIIASEKFVTDKVTESSDMFKNCASLKGGAGTVFDEYHIDKKYARIDGGTKKPGYFTKKQ